MTNREAFAAAMAVIAGCFDRKLTGPAIEGYWLALGDLDESELSFATKYALKGCKFMPSPSELLAFARPPRNVELEAAEAWEAVMGAVNKHDYTDSVDFGPLVNAVIHNMGGWYLLCDAKTTDLVWRRKDFERLYAEFASKPTGSLNGAPLIGAYHMTPTRIAIGGKLPPLQLPEPPTPTSDLVRELAEGKDFNGHNGVHK